jgi:hypothetical protein
VLSLTGNVLAAEDVHFLNQARGPRAPRWQAVVRGRVLSHCAREQVLPLRTTVLKTLNLGNMNCRCGGRGERAASGALMAAERTGPCGRSTRGR